VGLEDEVARLGNSDDCVTDKACEALPLLSAVVGEALRLYGGLDVVVRRVAPERGAMIGGFYVLGGVEVIIGAGDEEIWEEPLK
jgi:hypothetical protein